MTLTPQEVVFRTNSDSKSIILISDKVIYAKEGMYGGYIVYPKDFDMSVDELVELIKDGSVKAFFVEPTIVGRYNYSREYSYNRDVPKELKNIVDGVLSKFPEEVKEYFGDSYRIDVIQYLYVEVDVVIKRIDSRYVVVDFKPKPNAKKLTARAIRIVDEASSRKHAITQQRRLKEWKLKYPENEYVQKLYYSEGIAYKHVLEAPADLVPLVPKPEPIPENESIEDLGVSIEEIAKRVLGEGEVEEVELEEPIIPTAIPTAVEKTEISETPATPAKPELVKIYLLKFRLPSKYIVQKVKYEKNGEGYIEVRDFGERKRALTASALEGLRRKAYELINREFVYVDSYNMWIAVSEKAVEKARKISEWLVGELRSLPIKIDLKKYSIRAIPIYMDTSDAKELLSEAYNLLYSEIVKLQEKISEAEASKKKKNLKRLEQQLEYKQKLLLSLKKCLEELENK